MKRTLTKFIAFILLASSIITAFSGCAQLVSEKQNINFIVDGEVYGSIQTGGYEVITLPKPPSKSGYAFDGWYFDEGSWKTPFDATSLSNTGITAELNIYAKWKSESEGNNNGTMKAFTKDDCYKLCSSSEDSTYAKISVYHDENFYYNVYYIGKVAAVPIVEGKLENYQGGEFSDSYTISETNSESVENTLANTFSATTTFGLSVGMEVGAEFGITDDIKISLTEKTEANTSISLTNSIEEAVSYAKEHSQSFSSSKTFNFKNEDTGFYRYTLFADVYEFVIVRKAKSNDKIEKFAYSFIKDHYYAWEYRPDSNFTYTKTAFEFDFEKDIGEFKTENSTEVEAPSGTAENPILIYQANVGKLYESLSSNLYVKLVEDIDLSGLGDWTPIKNYSSVFDGNGKTITGFKVTCMTDNRAGMFALLSGTVKNLSFSSPTVKIDVKNQDIFGGVIAGIVNGNIDNCNIKECKLEGWAREENQEGNARFCVIGGFAGKVVESGAITNCVITDSYFRGFAQKHMPVDPHISYTTNGWSQAPYLYMGGISGELTGGRIENCTAKSIELEYGIAVRVATSYINPTAYYRFCVGGIVGRMLNSTNLSNDNDALNVKLNYKGTDLLNEYYTVADLRTMKDSGEKKAETGSVGGKYDS